MFGYRKAFVVWLALMASPCVAMTIVAAAYQYPGPRYIQDR